MNQNNYEKNKENRVIEPIIFNENKEVGDKQLIDPIYFFEDDNTTSKKQSEEALYFMDNTDNESEVGDTNPYASTFIPQPKDVDITRNNRERRVNTKSTFITDNKEYTRKSNTRENEDIIGKRRTWDERIRDSISKQAKDNRVNLINKEELLRNTQEYKEEGGDNKRRLILDKKYDSFDRQPYSDVGNQVSKEIIDNVQETKQVHTVSANTSGSNVNNFHNNMERVQSYSSEIVSSKKTEEDNILTKIESKLDMVRCTNDFKDCMEKVCAEIRNIKADKKRNIVNSQMFMDDNNKKYYIRKYFDNNTFEDIEFMYGVEGLVNVKNIEFVGIDVKKRYYAILFENVVIIAPVSKRQAKTLYDAFIDAGITFNPSIPTTVIYKVLQEKFAPMIMGTANKEYIPALSGWFYGEYKNANNCFRQNNFCDVVLPVQDKNLSNYVPGIEENYFKDMRRIKDVKYRTLVVMYSFYAILKSLLQSNDYQLDKCINIINASNQPYSVFTNWLKIMNRHNRSNLQSLFIRTKEMNELLSTTKDETIIFQLDVSKDDRAYEKSVQLDNASKIIDITTGKRSLPGLDTRNIAATSVFVSNQAIIRNNVINLYFDIDDYEVSNNKEIDYGGIFTLFIDYVQRHYYEIMEMMNYDRVGTTNEETLNIVYEIITRFFKSKGYNFWNEVDIPDDINLRSVFEDELEIDDREELVDRFINMVRKNAHKYYIVRDKRNIEVADKYMIYNREYLFIPREIFNEILYDSAMEIYSKVILMELESTGILVTDGKGYTVRKMVNGDRSEHLKLCINSFCGLGITPIWLLGKEIDQNV